MHHAEEERLTECLNCGAEVALNLDRGFLLSEDQGLCFACALARGGSYDERLDRWVHAPNVEGLPIREIRP